MIYFPVLAARQPKSEVNVIMPSRWDVPNARNSFLLERGAQDPTKVDWLPAVDYLAFS
jgi:hypothetical protein